MTKNSDPLMLYNINLNILPINDYYNLNENFIVKTLLILFFK
jgi:hypothetical protein